MALTHAPDPTRLSAGAGTAAAQAALPHRNADYENGGWVDGPSKTAVDPGDHFTDPNITASDAANATKLGQTGYVPNGYTAWTVGESFTVNAQNYAFHYNGIDWTPGAVPPAGGERRRGAADADEKSERVAEPAGRPVQKH